MSNNAEATYVRICECCQEELVPSTIPAVQENQEAQQVTEVCYIYHFDKPRKIFHPGCFFAQYGDEFNKLVEDDNKLEEYLFNEENRHFACQQCRTVLKTIEDMGMIRIDMINKELERNRFVLCKGCIEYYFADKKN